MVTRAVIATLIVYCLLTTLAVVAVQRLSVWLVSDSGTEAREAIALATGPWFARAVEPNEKPDPHARPRRETGRGLRRR